MYSLVFTLDYFIRKKDYLIYRRNFMFEVSKKSIESFDNKSYSVDIAITARSREEYDIVERLKLRANYNIPENFNILLVDYGSEELASNQLRQVCQDKGYKYIFVDTRSKPFNNSHARNVAILESDADYLIFEDIDLISHVDFYYWINIQIKSMLIDRNWPFLIIPVAYLSEKFSESMYTAINDLEYDNIISEIFDEDSDSIEFHAAASSHMICSRKMAKLVGGFDESFEGWGFEDSDFWLRFLRKVNIEKPRDFYRLDTRPYSNQTQWRGWRALFRIFADIMASKGIYSFHIWHQKAEHRSEHIRKRNHKIFQENSKRYAQSRWELKPLHNTSEPTDLFFSENPHSFNIHVFHHFDNPLLVSETNLDLNNLEDLLEKYDVRNVILNNPYGNSKRQIIYERLKELDIPVFVVERGALPNSIYIDPNGFCAESISYSEEIWKDVLTKDKIDKTQSFINEYKSTSIVLESQSNEAIGGENLKYRIAGAANNTKILFIALQSPSDTTTNFFCGDIGSYSKYIDEMQKICYLLEDKGWIVVYKNHPLTIEKVTFEKAICVDDYHINDILEVCDCVSLINSGVGVLAMIFGKPVYYFGQAFYATEGLNKKMKSADELYSEITKSTFDYDSSKAIGFLSYLINDFYSFASWKRVEKAHTDKAKMSVSVDIKYNILRVSGYEYIFDNDQVINLKKSSLFDRYRMDDYIHISNQKAKKNESLVQTENQGLIKNVDYLDKKFDSLEKVKKNIDSTKKYTLKSKTKKLLKDPNQFFADFFLKRM